MPVLYPHAQDRPLLDPKQLPIQINAPVSPEKGGAGLDGLISDEDGRGQAQEVIGSALRAVTDDDIMSGLASLDPEQLPGLPQRGTFGGEFFNLARNARQEGGGPTLSDFLLQRQRQASGGDIVEVPATQDPVSMEKALPSDAEVVVEMNEGGLVGQGQIRYPHTEAANALMGQVPDAAMGQASGITLPEFREQNPFIAGLERSGLISLSLPQYPSAMTNYIPETFGGGVFGSVMDLALRPQSDRINDFIREGMGRDYDAAKEARRLEREQAQMAPVVPAQEAPMPVQVAPMPAQEAPMMQALPGDAGAAVVMKNGGLVKQAQKVQGKGRYGDSMLVHMNPQEYQAMASLGGLGGLSANQVTINPDTGLPEMFSFKSILPTIAGLAGAAFGLPTWAVALGTGATTAITTGDIGKGLMAGLGSYALGSLADSFGSSAANVGAETAIKEAANAPQVLGATQATEAAELGQALANVGSSDLPGQSLASYMPDAPAFSGLPTQANPFGPLLPQGQPGALTQFSTPGPDVGTGLFEASGNLVPGTGPALSPVASVPTTSATMVSAGQPVINPTAGASPSNALVETTEVPFLSGNNIADGRLTGTGATTLADRTSENLISSGSRFRNLVDPRINPDAASVRESLAASFKGATPKSATANVGRTLYESTASPFQTGVEGVPTKFDLVGEGISNIGEEGFPGYFQTAAKGLGGLGMSAAGAGFFDPEPLDYAAIPGRRIYQKPDIQPLNRAVNLEGFNAAKTGIDPQFSFFAKNGKRGGLDTIHAQTGYSDISMAQMGRPAQGQGAMTQQGTPQTAQMRSAIMKAAQEVASNANPRAATGPAPRAVGLNPNAAVNALFSSNQNVRMQEGGVPSEAMMAQEGIMEVASEEVKDNLNERMSVTPDVSQPQNVEERSIYDRAMLAVQGMLEPEEAQMAIEEFIETFGPEAYNMISELARNPRDEGGVIKPANGGTTIANGAMQGEDIIAGKIVDPDTGEETANLRVGENEYIEPADSLSRRAMAAGLPGTPENGARVRGMEEEQLRQAFG